MFSPSIHSLHRPRILSLPAPIADSGVARHAISTAINGMSPHMSAAPAGPAGAVVPPQMRRTRSAAPFFDVSLRRRRDCEGAVYSPCVTRH
ncbi:hypothetical protein AGR4A_Lc130186 [Agrobacterium tumefaciens str. B6]|uniref:Uncharacterized protein n=1 Tax=Agrobacterium tumefaciens str. B6 TaxID=1183423 RepID=A0A822V7E0_AGRTU|nr:hypothetical protein AGR4A_Lc130186 [Agrobacterium tumefaciens str. B6]